MAVRDRFQTGKADIGVIWSVGSLEFEPTWDKGFDNLRFHRGDKFQIDGGPDRGLKECEDFVRAKLKNEKPGTVVRVRSNSDGYAQAFRRIEEKYTPLLGLQVLDHAIARLGTHYDFGSTDCSWLTMTTHEPEGVFLPHNAAAQHALAITIEIPRVKVLPGDLLFHHNDEHVSLYYGERFGYEVVVDTEPSDTGAPPGWPYPNLRTGVQFRPMFGNYYCNWSDVNGICRIVKINGPA